MTAGIKFHKVSHFFNSSNAHKLPHVGGPLVGEAMEFVKFDPKRPLDFEPRLKLVSGYDIPYLLGYDTKRDIAYGDRDFDPTSYEEGDATVPLLSHEQIEKDLEKFPHDWSYEQRHHVATHCEKLIVDARKWDWKGYSRWTTHSWHRSYSKWKGSVADLRVPATLDMSPYADEHEVIISKMRKAGAKDEGEEA
jgi:hypothetical protein